MKYFKPVGEVSNEIVKRLALQRAIEEVLQALGINDQIIIPTTYKSDSFKPQQNK
ncbi:MAG: hypothetical protein LBC04_03400 [Holosporaceae bacterium]|jgi:hypothetical protein|nr:hypothetical protein [Holosporaceae bacterium]